MASQLLPTRVRTASITTRTVAVSIALVAITLPSAAHAAPALLPGTDTVFTIECDQAGETIPALQLFSVDPTTAALTSIGAGDPSVTDSNCAGPAVTDPVTDAVYFIDQSRDNASLTSISPTTGSSSVIAEFRLASDGTTTIYPDALAIDPAGEAYAVRSGELYSLDLATALLELIGDGDSGADRIYALAAHPVTGTIFGVSSNGPSELFSFDPVSGEATSIVSISQTNIYSMAFDSTGTLWLTNYNNASDETELATVDIDDWNATYATVASMTLVSDPTYSGFYVQSLFITSTAWPEATDPDQPGGPVDPEPELAATGATMQVSVLVIGGALLLALGIGALTAGGRARRLP